MRIILFMVAVAMFGLGNEAFAQAAPKEVVVVDGQIAVNNLPASQTVNGTVSVDNLPLVQDVRILGATSPIPTVDTSEPQQFHIQTFSRGFSTTPNFIIGESSTQRLPAGFRLTGLSLTTFHDPGTPVTVELFRWPIDREPPINPAPLDIHSVSIPFTLIATGNPTFEKIVAQMRFDGFPPLASNELLLVQLLRGGVSVASTVKLTVWGTVD